MRIETGWYTRPKTNIEDRKCITCNVVEDEQHALHDCIAQLTDWLGNDIEHLENLNDVKRLLNPNSIEVANKVADFLLEIEKNSEIWST